MTRSGCLVIDSSNRQLERNTVMQRTTQSSLAIGVLLTGVMAWAALPVQAQNDWQYPDPYFGILEIEKSHDAATARRYRGEVNPTPRSKRGAAPAAEQTPVGEPAAATPPPAGRPRWRNRWRR